MDMQSGRGLPKNFRQIGSAEKSTKVYIEDYVYTFMRKLSQERELTVGALIGSNVVREDTECVFISGMVKALGYSVGDDRISITDDTWAQVFENVKRYFDGLTVCGWFISSPDSRLCSEGSVSGIYSCNNRNDSLLYIRDRENDEDFVYRVTAQDKILLSGYYIYYERNEQMQEYMIDTSGAKSVDPPPVNIMKKLEDKKKTEVSVLEEKNEEMQEAESERSPGRGVYVAASLLLISFLVLGISIYQRSNANIADIPVIANLSNAIRGRGSSTNNSTRETADVIIENAQGLINNDATKESESWQGENAKAQPDVIQDETIEAGTNEQPADVQPAEITPQAGEAAQPAEITPQAGEAAQPAEITPQAGEAAQPVIAPGGTYVVQAGDTLSSICAKAYGKEDPALIEAIRNMNGLESADYIFVGQVLSMP